MGKKIKNEDFYFIFTLFYFLVFIVCDGGEYAVGNFITSFDALDALLYQVSSTFSSATLITLAGFSAGGQMMNRYSFFSPLKIATSSKARVRLIVADPGSYLYLDNKRPDASCVTLTNTGIGASCSSFSVPATGTTTCKSYNNFKYGFADLSTYASVSPYVSAYSNSTLLSQAISSYIKKDINYLIGTLDVCNCNYAGMVNDASCASQTTTTCSTTVGTLPCCDTYPDSSSNSLDTSCWGMLQGSSRLQRATNYRDYLRNYYGVTSTSFSTFSGAHNTSALFSSTSYLNFAFSASGTGNEFDQGQGTLGGGTGGSNTNSIIGGAIGGVILLVGLIIGLIARNKFNKKHSFGGEAEVSKI